MNTMQPATPVVTPGGAREAVLVIRDGPDTKRCTIRGPVWVSRAGRVFEAQRDADQDGITHRPCGGCGALIPASTQSSRCRKCQDEGTRTMWRQRPVRDPGDGPVYSLAHDAFFDSLADALDDPRHTIEGLLLLPCRPIRVPKLDADQIMADADIEDSERPPVDLQVAVDAYNYAVRDIQLGWEPDPHHRIGPEGEQ